MSLVTLIANGGFQEISLTDCVVQNQSYSSIIVKEAATLPDTSNNGFILQPFQIEQFQLGAGNKLYASGTGSPANVYIEEIV